MPLFGSPRNQFITLNEPEAPSLDLSPFSELQGGMAQQQGEQMLPIGAVTSNPDGTVDIKGLSNELLHKALSSMETQGRLISSMELERKRLMEQEARLRANPIANVLSTVAGSLATSDPKLPSWVRGLGQASLALNPTAGQLGQQRSAIDEALSRVSGQQAQEAFGISRILASEHKEAQAERAAKARESLKFQQEQMTAVIRGEADPSMSARMGVQAGFLRPEQEETFSGLLNGIKKSFDARRHMESDIQLDREMKLLVAKTQADAEKQANLFAQQQTLADKRIAAMSAENDKKLAAMLDKVTAKKKDPPPTVKTALANLTAADEALDQIEALLKTADAKKYMGFWSGHVARLGAKVAQKYVDPEGVIQGMDSKLHLQTAQAIKSTGAGARGFGPQERPYFESMAEAMTRAPEQNLKIVQTWRAFLDQERRGYLAANPDMDLEKYADTLGPRLQQQLGIEPTATGKKLGAAPEVPKGWKIEVVK